MDKVIIGFFSFISAYFVFRQNDKSNQLKYITEERAKWRGKIRKLSVEFMTGQYVDYEHKTLSENELRNIREKVAVRLNPNDDEDNNILCLMNLYIENQCSISRDKIRVKLSIAFAELLKHDWDRVKAESKEKRIINLLELILLGFFSFQTFVIYKKTNGFTNSILECELLVYIFQVTVTFTFYFFFKSIIRVAKNDIEKALNKPSSLSNFLGLIVRTKIK